MAYAIQYSIEVTQKKKQPELTTLTTHTKRWLMS